MNKKILFLIGGVIVIIALFLGFLYYNKPHVNVYEKKHDYAINIDDLYVELQTNATLSIQKYSDKILLITGSLSTISKKNNDHTNIVVKGSRGIVNCELDSLYSQTIWNYQKDDPVTLKGLFVGFDDLLGEIQLKKCIIIE